MSKKTSIQTLLEHTVTDPSADHCIEHLRETLMCNADITPQRCDSDEASSNYMLDRHQQFPNCKNWADIWRWAEDWNTTGATPTNIGEPEKPV